MAASPSDGDDTCQVRGVLPITDHPSRSNSTRAKPSTAFSNSRRQAAACIRRVEHDVGLHAWKNGGESLRWRRYLPVQVRAADNRPPQPFQLDTGETEHSLLEQSTHPDLFAIRRDEGRGAGLVGGERQIESEARECNHEAVGCIVPPNLIGCQIGTGRAHAAYASLSEGGRQSAARADKFDFWDEPCHQGGGCSQEPIAWRVEGQILEAAEDFSSGEKQARLRRQDVDAAAYPGQNHLAATVSASEGSMKPALHRVSQQTGNQIRQIIEVVVHEGVEIIPNPR